MILASDTCSVQSATRSSPDCFRFNRLCDDSRSWLFARGHYLLDKSLAYRSSPQRSLNSQRFYRLIHDYVGLSLAIVEQQGFQTLEYRSEDRNHLQIAQIKLDRYHNVHIRGNHPHLGSFTQWRPLQICSDLSSINVSSKASVLASSSANSLISITNIGSQSDLTGGFFSSTHNNDPNNLLGSGHGCVSQRQLLSFLCNRVQDGSTEFFSADLPWLLHAGHEP